MSTASRIPPELSDTIIDFCDDLKTIGVCGMVCTAWLPRSRLHLFSTVQLWPWRISAFTELFASPSCTLMHYISRIEMNDSQTRMQRPGMPFARAITLPLLSKLIRVESFRIENVDWTTFSLAEQSGVAWYLAQMTRVASLELEGVIFHDMRAITDLLSSWSSVQQLIANISFMKYLDHVLSSARKLRLPSTLQILTLNGSDAIIAFLSCLPSSIHTLKLQNFTSHDMAYMTKALTTYSASDLKISLAPELYHSNYTEKCLGTPNPVTIIKPLRAQGLLLE
ncbi:hypothetical protein C8J56DRAFT_1127049 [Mycena floridula]|nr:hypothetical protein C8J56DRAFT_1127049 [Mycena floridula]